MAVNLSSLISVETVEKMKKSLEMLGGLESLAISNQSEYENAAEFQKQVKKAIKDIDGDRTATVKPLNDQVKAVNEKFKEVTERLENGAKKISFAMSKFFAEEEAKREAERKRLAIIAEEARRKTEEAAQKELEKAEAYRAQGREDMAEKAEARAEEKASMAAAVVAPEVEIMKTKGISYRTDYDVEITDKNAAIRELLLSPITAVAVEIDMASLKSLIKASQGKITLPGIKITEKKVQVVRT
jgi:hypothetical protein